MSNELAKTNALALPTDEDSIKRMAREIGKNVAFYVETMYPEAVKAASSSFLLSVRNHTYNTIMGAIQSGFTEDQQIAMGGRHRKTIRRLKKAKSVEEVIAIKEQRHENH